MSAGPVFGERGGMGCERRAYVVEAHTEESEDGDGLMREEAIHLDDA